MKKAIVIIIIFTISLSSIGQTYYQPGISGVYLQQIGIAGFKISNDFTISNNANNFEFGLDFILGKGNKNIDFEKYDRYNFEYTGYAPDFPGILGGPAFLVDLPKEVLPKTSSTKQFCLKVGYLRSFNLLKTKIKIGGGFYGAYVDSHYFLGTYEDVSIYFPAFYYLPTKQYDVAFFVSLRYINFGLYTKAEFEIFQNKKQPMNIELQYYWGDYHSGLWSLGVNVPFTLNKE